MSKGEILAAELLSGLERLNWERDLPRESADLVQAHITISLELPDDARQRFVAILADWLTAGVLGFSYDLREYLETMQASVARRDNDFQRFIEQAKQPKH